MWKDKQDGRRSDEVEIDGPGGGFESSRPEPGQDVSAFVGKGVVFKGTITYHGTVRIDGTLDGEINTEGVLLVGEEAVITAKVTAGTIVCKGKITGDIHAKEKMKLRAPAMINGGVTTPMLSMEEGVLFNGTLEMEQPVRALQRETVLHPVGPTGDTTLRKVNG
ncbi:MAG: polymer-forming cytoskeletal protein [Nitrospira sp.]